MTYRICPKIYRSDTQVIKLNSAKASELGLDKVKYGYIAFGLQKHQVKIEISAEAYKDELFIPKHISSNLKIPEFVEYEVSVLNNIINLGPFIGVIVDKNHDNITETRLKKLLNLTVKYSEINGAIVVFALDKINKSTLQIEGYCYNPKINFWVRGTYPYPSSIYTTVKLSSEWQNHFVSMIGNKIFNDRCLNDWELHSLLSSRHDISSYLPHAALFESFNDILPFLKKYNKVFLKSLDNIESRTIMQINNSNEKFIFRILSNDNKNEYTAKNFNDATRYADSILVPKEFIILEPLKMLRYDDRTTCIRTFMQKNLSEQWVATGMFARYGLETSVMGSMKDGVKTARTELIMKNALSLTDKEINNIKQKVVSLCKSVCDFIDKSGLNYGNLELDIAVGNVDALKILAINSYNPDFKIALKLKERVLFYNIKSMPLFYAKSLAGFKA